MTTNPNMDGTASVGSSTVPSRSDHRPPKYLQINYKELPKIH